MRPLQLLAASYGIGLLAACSGSDEPLSDHEHEGESDGDGVGIVTSALAANATIEDAVKDPACSTSLVKGISVQLLDEIRCLAPTALSKIDNLPKVTLGNSVFPYLQTSAVAGLKAAVAARGTEIHINSALRALPQQYLLYRYYQQKRCGITLAAKPGTSNHESGVALDVQDSAGWRTYLTNAKWRWLGASDPVHYDFIGGGTVKLSGLSVLAFQRLWNRNHPEDPIAADGSYGPMTEVRLGKSPAGGFAIGAKCDVDAGGSDAGVDATPPASATETETPPVVPDAEEPTDPGHPPLEDGEGCSAAPGPLSKGGALFGVGLAIAALLGRRTRRGR